MNPMDLRQQAQKAIKDSGLESEIFIFKSKSLRINIQDKEIESIENGSETGYAARVIAGKKPGFSFSNSPDFSELLIQAKENSSFMEEDIHCRLFEGSSSNIELDIYDQEINNAGEKDKINAAFEIEKAAYDSDSMIKKTGSVSYVDSDTEIIIVNSNGINCSYRSNYCGGYAEAICEKDSMAEEGLGFSFAKKRADFDPAFAGKEAGLEAVSLMGGIIIESANLPVVFDPLVGAEFLDAISSLVFAESVQKGKSAFAGKLNSKIAANCVNIIDDALMNKGLRTAPFDDEGSPSKKNEVIKDGVLSTYLYNMYTALKDGVKTTSNASRASFKSPPGTGVTNFYIVPGATPQKKLIGKVSKGLLVTKVMAMHSVNPISGDFSVGASGFMIENGQKTFPIRGITIAGNLIDLLHSIEEIGSDLRFSPFASNCGSPSLLISSLSIGGR